MFAGYSHGRACLGAVGAPASVFLALPEEVAACVEGVAVRLDPSLLRALLRSELKAPGGLTESGASPEQSDAVTFTQAFDYGLAVAVVECDILELP